MTAPERIYIDRGPRGGWMHRHERMPDTQPEYILHTRAALASSPLVQEIVAEAVKAEREALGITKPLTAELLQWIDDEMGRWPTDTAYADDLARFAAAIRARGEGQPQEKGE